MLKFPFNTMLNLFKLLPSKHEANSARLRRQPGSRRIVFTVMAIFAAAFFATFLLGNITNTDRTPFDNPSVTVPIVRPAYAEPLVTHEVPITRVPESAPENVSESAPINSKQNEPEPIEDVTSNENYTVQAVLGAKHQVVLASGIDAKIVKLGLESGDRFKKNQVLIEYDCTVDYARLNEVLSRQRVTENQLVAFQKLVGLESASNMELIMARENNEQNKALIAQIRGRLQSCKHIAPWNGRVMRKMASQFEYVQTGRVLMEISSLDPLRAEFLIPSRWLQWLNTGTPLDIYIGETGQNYDAKVVSIHGEVDPVSQSIQVVAEMEKYHEELLPGMSGRAIFSEQTAANGMGNGFLGLKLLKDEAKAAP